MIYYNSTDKKCKSILGAIKKNEICSIKLYTTFFSSCFIIIKSDDKTFYKKIKMQHFDSYFHCNFKIEEVGLYWYYFLVDEKLVYCGNFKNAEFSNIVNYYQLTVYDNINTNFDEYLGKVMYQIFPDRFNRVDINLKEENNRIIRNIWGETPNYKPNEKNKILNNDYFCGNIKGIIEKIDYLKELNVDIIYLNPIFEANSNHRYDTCDFFVVDKYLGDIKDFEQLIFVCKQNNIKIILDGVFNHVGDNSRYFNKFGNYEEIGAYQSKESKYYEWFNFTEFPKEYESWWGIETLPSINENAKSYIDFITGENGVIDFWMKKGVSGFRLDVADELPDEFIEKIKASIKNVNKDGILIGEVWEDASNKISYSTRKKYFLGKELDSVMNYPLKESIIESVKNSDFTPLIHTIINLKDNYPKFALDLLMNIVSSHDTARILNEISNVKIFSKEEMATAKLSKDDFYFAKENLKIATLLQFTVFGIPCIYYGDEVGLEGYKDPFNRKCFPWNNKNFEILNWYKLISNIRKISLFKNGELNILYFEKKVFIFERRVENRAITIAINLSEREFYLNYDGKLYNLLNNTLYNNKIELKPNSMGVYYDRDI